MSLSLVRLTAAPLASFSVTVALVSPLPRVRVMVASFAQLPAAGVLVTSSVGAVLSNTTSALVAVFVTPVALVVFTTSCHVPSPLDLVAVNLLSSSSFAWLQ